MTEVNNQNGGPLPRAFAEEIAADLLAGRAVELAEVYAVDALSDSERTAIEQYVAAAPPAERESFNERVRQARETLATSFAVEEEPPAGLFDRIVSQLPAPAPQLVDSVDSTLPAVPDDLAAARRKRDERRRPAGIRNWLVGVAAAAVIALGGVGIGAYVADQNDPLNQVIRADDAREAIVDVTGGGTATVLVSSSRDAVVVRMNGVPAPPTGKVYQMWLIPRDGSAPVSQGLMDAAALSKPALVKNIASAAALGITVEPLGGSTFPTLPTVAAAPLGT
ncbi:anti-sigma factor [Pseudarthrobacter sp. N5]|uniref:anti-sigma factor n=1 Tax=Pseudarthrobacter sp. N5 TaxID=3418416 RepID=UPI003CEB9641